MAKDFRPRSRVNDKEALFAATPPLQLVKMIVVWAARHNKGGRRRKVMFVDISKAHLYAPVQEEEYVDLPPEKAQAGKCARLLHTLYGMRTAASNWEREYSGILEDAGFAVGRATSCAFYHPGRDVRIVVLGDDFVVEGEDEDLEWVRSVLEAKYIVKMRGIVGPEEKDKKCIEIFLERGAVEWRNEELWWKADPRHVERILEDIEMVECNGSYVPGVKLQEADGDDDELRVLDLTKYRSVVARANFAAQNRPDIQYSVKELCRDMSRPVQRSIRRLKKPLRYLKAHPRLSKRSNSGIREVSRTAWR